MADREMLAYALIAIASLVYGIVLIRWWYKMRFPFRRQKNRRGGEYLGTKATARTTSPSNKDGDMDGDKDSDKDGDKDGEPDHKRT